MSSAAVFMGLENPVRYCRLALGMPLRAARAEADVRYWHSADIKTVFVECLLLTHSGHRTAPARCPSRPKCGLTDPSHSEVVFCSVSLSAPLGYPMSERAQLEARLL